MLITKFDSLCAKGKRNKAPEEMQKTMGHCYDGCGWNTCDWWWFDKKGRSRCGMFGDAVKLQSESLEICNKMFGHHYSGRP